LATESILGLHSPAKHSSVISLRRRDDLRNNVDRTRHEDKKMEDRKIVKQGRACPVFHFLVI